jgi:ParB/RepB/Spo0J family partition protein
MINLNNLEICRVPFCQIDRDFRLTDFSLTPHVSALEYSIQKIGITHPLLLVRRNEGYGIISGHRRFQLAESLKLPDLPARVVDTTDEIFMLEANLIENASHRQYSDVEKSLILQKFFTLGVPEKQVTDKILPILGLEKNRKLYVDLLDVETLPQGLRMLMHEMKAPLRYFSVCFRWEIASLAAVEALVASLRPGLNKLRDMLALLDETAQCGQTTVAELLSRAAILAVLKNDNLSSHDKYDRIFQEIYQWRYPMLSDMKKRVLLAMDKLKLNDKIKIRTAENFENGELKVEFKFTRQEELKKYSEQLSGAAESEALAELIRVFRETR